MLVVSFLAFSSLTTGLLALRTVVALRRYAYRPLEHTAQDTEKPTVSVCIAARNETHALAQCLERVLASDYEKLEILVLDDSSDDDTSLIIKSFAHAGVRFIAGRDLPQGWLGKNHAYQTLAEEASGDYLLFLDVDTAVKGATISRLVNHLHGHKKTMLSVLPRREDSYRASAIFGSLRYFWELVLSSRNSPPASSALWLVKRTALLGLERGLPDYGMSVRPEMHVARQLRKTNDYHYLIGTHDLGVHYEKRWSSQLETAGRLYYPIFGHQPLLALVALVCLVSLVFPLIILIAGLSTNANVQVWALVLTLISFFSFCHFTFRTYGSIGWQIRVMLWSYVVVQDIFLCLFSCLRYATKTVTWKGRLVQARPVNRSHYTLDE